MDVNYHKILSDHGRKLRESGEEYASVDSVIGLLNSVSSGEVESLDDLDSSVSGYIQRQADEEGRISAFTLANAEAPILPKEDVAHVVMGLNNEGFSGGSVSGIDSSKVIDALAEQGVSPDSPALEFIKANSVDGVISVDDFSYLKESLEQVMDLDAESNPDELEAKNQQLDEMLRNNPVRQQMPFDQWLAQKAKQFILGKHFRVQADPKVAAQVSEVKGRLLKAQSASVAASAHALQNDVEKLEVNGSSMDPKEKGVLKASINSRMDDLSRHVKMLAKEAKNDSLPKDERLMNNITAAIEEAKKASGKITGSSNEDVRDLKAKAEQLRKMIEQMMMLIKRIMEKLLGGKSREAVPEPG